MPVDATLKSNLRWGVTNGLRVAFALSVFVTLEFLVLGSAPFDRIGATLGTTILAYLLMGILAGAVVGAFRPQANRSMGAAAVVGAAAGLPSAVAMLLAVKGMPGLGPRQRSSAPWSAAPSSARTQRSGMSQTEPGNARVSDRAWFWKMNGLSVVFALLSLLIFYLVRNRPNSPIVLLGVAQQTPMSPRLHVIAALINGVVVGSILVLGANAWAARRHANQRSRSTYRGITSS